MTGDGKRRAPCMLLNVSRNKGTLHGFYTAAEFRKFPPDSESVRKIASTISPTRRNPNAAFVHVQKKRKAYLVLLDLIIFTSKPFIKVITGRLLRHKGFPGVLDVCDLFDSPVCLVTTLVARCSAREKTISKSPPIQALDLQGKVGE